MGAVYHCLTAAPALRAMGVWVEPDGRATDLGDALLATSALSSAHLRRDVKGLRPDAGALEDDGRGTFEVQGLGHQFFGRFWLQGVHLNDRGDVRGPEHGLDAHRRILSAHERTSRARMRLHARHGRSGIIQHADGNVMIVVSRIHHAGDTGSEEGGIPHEGDGLLAWIHRRDALGHGNATAHTQARIHGI